MTDSSSKAVKPPVGLKPRKTHDLTRIREISSAIERYVDAEKQIPADWLKELGDLSKTTLKK